MADRYDLRSYPVRLRSGTVADDGVSADESAVKQSSDRRQTLSAVSIVVWLSVGVVVYEV